MKIELVTFDCAGTLLDVNWEPASFAVDVATRMGIAMPPHAHGAYMAILRRRWPQYQELNRTRDPAETDGFWLNLTRDWLTEIDVQADAAELVDRAMEQLFHRDSQVIRLFDDVVPALEGLRRKGLRMAVISNWDTSLHRAIEGHGLTEYFELRVASLEYGVEKPDPALFCAALEVAKVAPNAALHVGDDPLDDVRGAKSAGLHAVLIDRSQEELLPIRVATLSQLPEVIASIG